MRVGRVVVGVVLALAGMVIFLAVVGVPASAVVVALQWSPSILCAAGLVLLLVSVRPWRTAVVATMLLLAGGLGLLATHKWVGRSFWLTTLAVLLMLAGAFLVTSGARRGGRLAEPRSPGTPTRIHRFPWSREEPPVPADVTAMSVTTWFTDTTIPLPHAGLTAEGIEIDATALFGKIIVQLPADLSEDRVAVRRAFILSARGLTTATPDDAERSVAVRIVAIGIAGDIDHPHVLATEVEPAASGSAASGPT